MCSGPLVMEDDGRKQSVEVRPCRRASSSSAPETAGAPATPIATKQGNAEVAASPPDTARNVHAGICNGRHSDCMVAGKAAAQGEGVRHHAQVRLNDCEVDYKRLTSSVAHEDLDLQRHHRNIRRLMRETYGALCFTAVCPRLCTAVNTVYPVAEDYDGYCNYCSWRAAGDASAMLPITREVWVNAEMAMLTHSCATAS